MTNNDVIILGIMIWRSAQEEYDGDWSEGLQNGYGIGITLKNGKRTIYRGMWQNGHHHGEGRAEYSDGSVLVGHWKMGRKVGHFQVLYSTGQNDDHAAFQNDNISTQSNQNSTDFESLTGRVKSIDLNSYGLFPFSSCDLWITEDSS